MIRPLLAFNEQSVAQAVAAKFSENKITASVSEESDKTKSIYTVEVDEPRHAYALDIFEKMENAEAIRCPGCESSYVEFPSRARASGIANALSTLADAVVPPKAQSFLCRHCNNEWK